MLLFDALAGIGLGMFYDVLRVFRQRSKRAFTDFLFDLLFWAGTLVICVYLFLLTGDRKFRFYELFGVLTGIFCYFLVISEYFVKISEKIADILLFFLKILFTIIKFFAIITKNGVLFLFTPFLRVKKFGKRKISKGIGKWKQNWKLMKRI